MIQLGPAQFTLDSSGRGYYEGFPVSGSITSLYGAYEGFRKKFLALQPDGSYKTIDVGPHTGVDIAAPEGTPILAPAPGKVMLVGQPEPNPAYANYLYLDHGNEVITRYLHMQYPPELEVGDYIKRGDLIGVVGQTGKATGPHLHWEVRHLRVKTDPLLEVRSKLVVPDMARTKLSRLIFPRLWSKDYEWDSNGTEATITFRIPV